MKNLKTYDLHLCNREIRRVSVNEIGFDQPAQKVCEILEDGTKKPIADLIAVRKIVPVKNKRR